MARLFLHIGPHKTGSTYLQKRLCEQRGWLRDLGFSYLDIGQDFLWGHHSVVQWLKNAREAELERLAKAVESEGRRYPLLGISSENFEDLGAEEVARLKQVLGPAEVRVVYYARRWPGLLYADWQEGVKHGDSVAFPELVLLHLARPQRSARLNYAVPLARYAEVFGKDAIRVVSYDNLKRDGVDLFQHFLTRIVGLPRAPAVAPEKVNASLAPQTAEVLRALNAVHFARTGKRSAALRARFLELRKQQALPALPGLLEEAAGAKTSLRVGEGGFANAAVLNAFAEEYRGCWVNPSRDGSLFGKVSDPEIEYCSQDYLTKPGAVDSLLAIYAQVSA